MKAQRPLLAGLLLTALLALTGCAGHTGDEHKAATPDTPAQTCAKLVGYWAEQALLHGKWAGLDWAQKGMSTAQAKIHDDIVRAARDEEQRHGTDAARKLIVRQAETRCAAENGATCCAEHAPSPTPAQATRPPGT
ncbi:hypothetical protein [Streptomyces orinoci]|uniref:Lipoprotein n=1 Tax=Streptomyces orinoci TaxID=67339 RepID=A0ABV3JX41_STRON|nr:hypothetical protein [Streptomyces orinoci]